ncbi:hypothetical protein [Psychrobacillus sp. OK028]|uniref:hypothetical protein n=1 Tax=Psychrobacillus sp. OK028 TaxID=1884359 RepID=UPI000B81C05A|nr:hypothetical protein [Psychrobacillus sp. OK028]
MTVNNGANLSREYFIAYLKLVMAAKSYTIEQAKNFITNNFFKRNKDIYGKDSYINFLQAIEILKNRKMPS